MIVLFDTNVVLDVLLEREPHYAAASRLWMDAEAGRVRAFVSAITFNNVFYICRKGVGRDRAWSAVSELRKVYRLVPFDDRLLDDAIGTGIPDLEDATQLASARRVGAEYLTTRDPAGFAGTALPIVSPDELLVALSLR